MCDPGESSQDACKREFLEEATNSNCRSDENKKSVKEFLSKLFENGKEVNYFIGTL